MALPHLRQVHGVLSIYNNQFISNFSAANLAFVGSSLFVQYNLVLTHVNLPLLAYIGDYPPGAVLAIMANPELDSVEVPRLGHVGMGSIGICGNGIGLRFYPFRGRGGIGIVYFTGYISELAEKLFLPFPFYFLNRVSDIPPTPPSAS